MGEGLRLNEIVCGDALEVAKSLPDASVDCALSSPPYFLLRNYGGAGQWGSESTLEAYLEHLWALYDEVRRVLKPTGTCFVNVADTYMNDPGGQNGGAKNTLDYGKGNGRISAKIVEANRQAGRQERRGMAPVPRKSLMLMPERFALGMVERGWILRNRICWTKPNAMPSSVRDRFACTWEYVWFFSKSGRYWSDLDAVRVPHSEATIKRVMQASVHEQEGVGTGKGLRDRWAPAMAAKHAIGRNPGDTWEIPTQPLVEAHFAMWPADLARRIIRFGCPPGGVVFDPFMGSGTTALVALQEGRNYLGSELNAEYIALAEKRIAKATGWARRDPLPLAAPDREGTGG